MTNHTALHRFGTWALALVMTGLLASQIPAAPPAPSHVPAMTFIDQPTPRDLDTVMWAVERFVAAGLQLPDLTISFPVYCEGKGALYKVGESSLELCRVNRKNVLHELAHAWDDTSGAVDRAGFMKLRDVDVWFGGLDTPSPEQGCEHLAIIVAWGLMEPGTGSAHGLPHNSDEELTVAFRFLTGHRPLGPSSTSGAA
jgi:hypothetical protein